MRKTLCVTWISNCDYPIFRQWLERHHAWFDQIIICWDINFRFPFYNAFIQSSLSHLPNIMFLDTPDRELGVADWRDTATNEMLKHATGDWIISIEQDWFSRDWDKLLSSVERAMETTDLIGWMNPTNFPYIHPAFWCIRKSVLDRTTKDFKPHPEINGADHFSWITKEVKEMGAAITSLQDLGFDCEVTEHADSFHLGGVNMNYLNGLQEGFVFHRPEIFYVYNYWCRRASVQQDQRFIDLSYAIEEKLKTTKIDSNPALSVWRKFFL